VGVAQFSKFYVCTIFGWNPFDEATQKLSDVHFVIMAAIYRELQNINWTNYKRPHAELIGQIANPEAFQVYWKYRKREESIARRKTDDKQYSIYNKTKDSESLAAHTNAVFDPVRGLVDENGKVLMSVQDYEKLLDLDGVAISY